MSHQCRYVEGECTICADEAIAEAERMIRAQRGRWMVVDENGGAYRMESKRAARAHVNLNRSVGIRSHLRRWRRDRVCYVYLGYEVSDSRWLPLTPSLCPAYDVGMKRKTAMPVVTRQLVLRQETLRLVSGAGPDIGPEPTHSSGAQSCTTTKYGCCG